jgi:hypothetical protein
MPLAASNLSAKKPATCLEVPQRREYGEHGVTPEFYNWLSKLIERYTCEIKET